MSRVRSLITAGLLLSQLAPAAALAQRNACGIWSEGQTVVATAVDTIRRSTDGGASWTDIPLRTPRYFPVCAIAGSGAHVVVAGSLGQIYHSADSGRTWTGVMSGTADDVLHDVWASGQTFVTVGDGMRILQSTNGGARWTRVPLPSLGADSLFSVVGVNGSGDTVIAVTTQHILRSTDVGSHWKKVWTPDGFVFHNVWADGATVIAIGSWETIVRSTDAGATWTVVHRTPRPAPVMDRGALVYPGAGGSYERVWGRGGTWIIVGSRGAILRSTDDGVTWASVTSGTTKDLRGIRETAAGLIAFASEFGGAGVRVRSTDGGATWTPQP